MNKAQSNIEILKSWLAICWDSTYTAFYLLKDGRTLTHGQMMKAGYLTEKLSKRG